MSTQDDTTAPVKYVGKRDEYTDGTFETGAWKQGQTKLVPTPTAHRMFVHKNVYVPGLASKEAKVEVVVPDKDGEKKREDEASQDLRDQVQAMDKQALQQMALERYQIPIDKRISLEKTRLEVIGLIDQYGPL